MPIITLNKRSSQSSPLSIAQVDANWTTLEDVIATLSSSTGSVTSVGLTTSNDIFSIGNSPITSSGNITLNFASKAPNLVLASPSGSSSGLPVFRYLQNVDLPVVSINRGGTNSSTALVNNKVMVSSGGSVVESLSITTTMLGFLNGIDSLSAGFLKTTGSALTSTGSSTISLTSDVSGILPVANGGTGYNASTAANGRLLIGNGSGFTLATITAGSGISVTNGSGSITIANTGLPSLNGLTGAVSITTGSSGEDFNVATSTPNVIINIPSASEETRGLLTKTDWTTFNSKEPALTKGDLTEATTSVLTITGGTGAVIGSGTTIQVKQADATTSGYLSDKDWKIFNNKLGGDFANNVTSGYAIPNFSYSIWHTSANITLPQITSADITKFLIIKNTNASSSVVVDGYSTNTIDGNSTITLSHGTNGQGSVMLQASTTSTWVILSSTGTITTG